MAKGIGLIGNFRGKVGNMVGYNLKDSNNKQTQGVRVYQPIVKNPKTAAQAEQRAKLLAVNATYRALKMVIDRGNETLPYGNKSRLAWLKSALKAENMPWFEKGALPNAVVVCQLTKGSLAGVNFNVTEDSFEIVANGVSSETSVATIGAVSTAIMGAYPTIKKGDQVTLVFVGSETTGISTEIFSFVVDPASTETTDKFQAAPNSLKYEPVISFGSAAVILSREGTNGEHLRSTSSLKIDPNWLENAPYDADSKAAAIASYRTSGATGTDWAEESIQ